MVNRFRLSKLSELYIEESGYDQSLFINYFYTNLFSNEHETVNTAVFTKKLRRINISNREITTAVEENLTIRMFDNYGPALDGIFRTFCF